MLCGLIGPELIDSLLIGFRGFSRAVNDDVEAEEQGSHPFGPVEIERRKHGSNRRRVRQEQIDRYLVQLVHRMRTLVSLDFQIIPH